jgi:hypothetical protein
MAESQRALKKLTLEVGPYAHFCLFVFCLTICLKIGLFYNLATPA